MKFIFLNLKRFDVPKELGGVNAISNIEQWGGYIANTIKKTINKYEEATFVIFFPEAHILSAKTTLGNDGILQIGCQSVHFENVMKGGNFGAFTVNRPAAAAAALGCTWTIIGHCEERNYIKNILREGGCTDFSAVDRILEKKIKCAVESGIKILYCVGETLEEQPIKEKVLTEQLAVTRGYNNIIIGYEPVWSIGPGKTPPDADYIRNISKFVKTIKDCPVVYGGGLKAENASMLKSIDSIDGGLIALTRFTGEIGFYPNEYADIVEKYLTA